MPVRSSICAYSPASASSKYSSVSPSYLSVGHYKPLGSSVTGGGSSSYLSSPSASSTLMRPSSSGSRYSSGPSSSAAAAAAAAAGAAAAYSPAASYSTLPSSSKLSPNYASSKLSSYTPSSASSSSSIGHHYRPLSSAAHSRYSSSASGATSSSSSSLSSAGSSLLERTENLLLGCSASSSAAHSGSSTTSGYASSSSTIGSRLSSAAGHYHTYHPSAAGRRRISRTSFDGSSSTDSLPVLSPASPRSSYSHRHQQQYEAHSHLPSEVPRGLVNLGNTCYMNSAMQSLYSIDAFRQLILHNSPAAYDKPLLSELSSLFKAMKREHSSPSSSSSSSSVDLAGLSPRGFHNAFSRRHQAKFTEFHQQDAQEFLRYLINSVHEECNRASKRPRGRTTPPPRAPRSAAEAWAQYRDIVDDSPFVDLLVGQMCSTIVCSSCQNKSLCWDPFWDLSLPLQRGRHYGSYRLADVIEDFCAKETLDADERPICGQCKRATRSSKQIRLSRLPRLLILHLKKFSNDGYKLTSPDVKIDKTLNFNDDEDASGQTTTYCLSACISHHGHSASSGHYTSHCKYSSRWFHFNDDRVRDVTSSFDSAKLEDAYVLFYTQQQSAVASSPDQQRRNSTAIISNHQSKL